MGNFEKVGVLVIITLVVIILTLMIWGMNVPEEELFPGASGRVEISKGAPTGNSGGGDSASPASVPGVEPAPEPEPRPTPWPEPAPEPAPAPAVDPEPAPAPAPAPVRYKEHVVKKGETLYGIAKLYFGDGKYYRAILRANPGISPNDIRIGDAVRIPPREEVVGGPTPSTPPAPVTPQGATTYVVKKGDSLWSIAKKTLGSGAQYKRIHDANRAQIGDDPGNLHLGMRLVIPR